MDAVIYSSAIKPGNVAYDAALAARIPLVRRAEALAAIVRRRDGIIVAGTHGKTTTSSMAAHVLRQAGLHPGHYVGAEIPILGTNAHWDDEGHHFVAEGDESDGTLVQFTPAHAIILNIEEEHLDHYKDWNAIADVFRTLLAQTSGHIIYCAEDAGARRSLRQPSARCFLRLVRGCRLPRPRAGPRRWRRALRRDRPRQIPRRIRTRHRRPP